MRMLRQQLLQRSQVRRWRMRLRGRSSLRQPYLTLRQPYLTLRQPNLSPHRRPHPHRRRYQHRPPHPRSRC
ncbi:hypothetical protein ASF40_17090 [Microbacterium sp. Leaf288]|nr:hypothetical protein ASF40_17090 [Microbacterium sp. Leaf288]